MTWPIALVAAVNVARAEPTALEVRDRADGDAVEGAHIEATDSAGLSFAADTDPRGRATLELAEPGPWTLAVTADGYTRAVVELTGDRRGEGPVKVWLVAGGVYEVVVEGLKPTADPTRHTVDGEMALETPGTLDDSVRLVQSLPGVTVQREYSPSSGDLSVRGSAPGDSRYYLDGVEIPYLYHFNQYASVFPATQVGRLDLYPSTFSARFGDAVGGIVEAESRLDPPDEVHGGASINFVMATADVTAPLSPTAKRGDADGWWLSASGRRSYQDLAGESSAQYTVWPTFHDFAVRAERGNRDDGFGVFALGAGDSYTRAVGELDVLDPLETDTVPYLAYRQGFQVLGARRQWAAGNSGVSGRVVGAFVHHRRESDLAGLGDERLDTTGFTSRLDASVPASKHVGWDLGYELHLDRVALEVNDAGPLGVRVAEEAPALARGVSLDEAMLRMREAGYATVKLHEGPVWVMPGLRVSADNTAAEVQVEPRLSARWSVTDRGMFKVGAGRYTQRPDSELLFDQIGADLPTTRSWQVSAGWEEAIAGRLELGIDVYRKWLYDPLVMPIDAPPYPALRGDAVGAELTTRYRLRELVYMWGWLAVQQTTLQETADAARTPAGGDQRLSGGVVVSWDVGRFNLGARYRFASGLPFTPLEGSVYDAGNDTWLPIAGPTNGARLPAYHKFDARIAYEWLFRGWSLEAVVEVWAVPRSSAQLYPVWNYDYTEQGYVVGPTFLPLAGLRARF